MRLRDRFRLFAHGARDELAALGAWRRAAVLFRNSVDVFFAEVVRKAPAVRYYDDLAAPETLEGVRFEVPASALVGLARAVYGAGHPTTAALLERSGDAGVPRAPQ